jgi:hypothetical protein
MRLCPGCVPMCVPILLGREGARLFRLSCPEGNDADGEREGEQAGQSLNARHSTAASTEITLHQLRMDPSWVGLATMLEEMAKLRRIRELALPDGLFPGIARKVLAVYRNRASVEEPSRLRAHPTAKRLTYLSTLCFLRAQEITNALETCVRPCTPWMGRCHAYATKCGCCPTGRRSRSALRR